MHKEFQRLLMTGGRDNGQKPSKISHFPHLWPPKIFSKIGLCALTSCKKLEKTVSEIFEDGRTDWPLTNGQGRLLRTPLGKLGVQIGYPWQNIIHWFHQKDLIIDTYSISFCKKLLSEIGSSVDQLAYSISTKTALISKTIQDKN